MPGETGEPQAPGTDDAASDALFAEFAAAKSDPNATPAADPAAGEDEGTKDEPVAETAETPEAEPTEEVREAAAVDQPAKGKEPAIDWTGVDPAVKAAYDKLQHRIKSDEGRVAAYQRKLAELQTPATAAPGAAKPEEKKPAPKPTETEGWKAFKTEYPDVAEPVEAAFAALEEQTTELNGRFAALDEQSRVTVAKENLGKVVQEHPDYLAAVGSQEFAEWFATAPAFAQDAVRRNGTAVVNPAEVSALTRMFKADTGWTPPAAAEADRTAGAASNPLNARRQRVLETSGATPNNRPSGQGGGPGTSDEEALFNYYTAQREKKAGRRA